MLFAILQKYDFSSKSQLYFSWAFFTRCCLRYCKSTIFQANHNEGLGDSLNEVVVCDTAKVRFFKQITTWWVVWIWRFLLFAILQKYDFSSKSQHYLASGAFSVVVCDTAKVRFFKQITTRAVRPSKACGCLRYCKSTIFQANHNRQLLEQNEIKVVCDTAKVRFFKQITTLDKMLSISMRLFAILQKYDFSSKSQHNLAFSL